MATTSFSLGEHWDNYLDAKVASGEFKTKAEVIRDALRRHQERDEYVKAFLADMQKSRDSGFVDMPTIEELEETLDRRLAADKNAEKRDAA